MNKPKYQFAGKCIDSNDHMALGYPNKKSAWQAILLETPELEEESFGGLTENHLKEVVFNKCKDCETFWVGGDGVCGECGEVRLGKRDYWGYLLERD